MNRFFSIDKKRFLTALGVMVFCLYAPFSWLLWIDYPWNGYRLYWLKLWPILPGFIPGSLMFHPEDFAEFATMGITTVLLIGVLTYIGTRGRFGLMVAAAIGLLVSVPTAFLTYGVFRS